MIRQTSDALLSQTTGTTVFTQAQPKGCRNDLKGNNCPAKVWQSVQWNGTSSCVFTARGYAMFIPFRALMLAFALISGLITSYSVFAQETELFDRLDGTGPSHKKVDVIEWEGNLEVHVYPKGSMVKGFSAKLDDRTEGKKVMVIGYRFEGMKKPLVRRAILGVPFTKDLKAYVDPTQKDFDKFALSNQVLPKPFIPYKMEPAPKQWYPDGDPRNEDESSDRPILTGTDGAVPAAIENKTAVETKKVPSKRSPASAPVNDNADAEGGIKSFSW